MKRSEATSIFFMLAAFVFPVSTYGQNQSQLLIQELRSMQKAAVDTFSLELNECSAITRPLRERAAAMIPEIKNSAMEDRSDLTRAQSDAMSCLYCPSQMQKRKQQCDSLAATLDGIELRWQEPAAQPAQDLTPW